MLKKLILLLCFTLIFTAACAQKDGLDYQTKSPNRGETIAIMKTNMGEIKIKFFTKEAPKTVENFVTHAKNGYYDGLTFHRVIKDFMIQGGDPLGTGTGGESIWGKPFEDEFNENLHAYRGALAMANSGPNSNGSQFFIIQKSNIEPELEKWMMDMGFNEEKIAKYKELGGTPWLDNKHTVFGQVYEGMDIVDKIVAVNVGENNKPENQIIIEKIEIMKR